MPRQIRLQLTDVQRAELIEARDSHPKAYIREQAAIILSVADGKSIRQVSMVGVKKPRRRQTVRMWIYRYVQGGIANLLVRQGRGRKPLWWRGAQPEAGGCEAGECGQQDSWRRARAPESQAAD